jgi:hypothetical protein
MAGWAAWWRRAGGILAALLLAVAVVAPAASAAACTDSAPVMAGAAALPDGAQRFDAGPCDDGGCLCLLCGCQNGPAYGPPPTARAVDQPLGRYEGHVLVQARPLRSDPVFGFKRPPRR